MRLLLALILVLVVVGTAPAKEIEGVRVEPQVTVNAETLKLNGSGTRKKFFVRVYVGSLYSARRLTSGSEAIKDSGDKLIRMDFVYPKVEKEKIVEAFQEGIHNNTPELSDSEEVKKFLSFFTDDFKRGDQVDLYLGGDGTVTAKHNGKVLGTIVSPPLATAVLAIYLGDKPADANLKKGMLGK
ncbi:chalcone isomerase family protein [Geomonas subterranea]|uniref:Chalcone isomerase family protein n=1 Tax=Geomonas subterranea TaxID=2847989 RepID=A0ABX8LH08_9BACT|nr:chalcone isomerase family protein [Geomonas subterranea]QXE90196.1 chalcone isomerase family protein [Geomonas subterranea]QXM07678.1 chalcone isomerase family protein [Geomonas subterranea]